MIRFILLQNRAGKTRLAKYYVPITDTEKRKLEYDVHRLIVGRDPKHTNFVEVRRARALQRPQVPAGGRRAALCTADAAFGVPASMCLQNCQRRVQRHPWAGAPAGFFRATRCRRCVTAPQSQPRLPHVYTPTVQFKTYKVVYRRYAGLFFSIGKPGAAAGTDRWAHPEAPGARSSARPRRPFLTPAHAPNSAQFSPLPTPHRLSAHRRLPAPLPARMPTPPPPARRPPPAARRPQAWTPATTSW
jgi:hypothetical protein